LVINNVPFISVIHFFFLRGLFKKEQDNAGNDAQNRNNDAQDGDGVVAHGIYFGCAWAAAGFSAMVLTIPTPPNDPMIPMSVESQVIGWCVRCAL
jgi:hypothetical protein